MASKFRLCRSRLSKTVGRTAPAPVSLAAILCWLPLAAQAQVLIFQETFETEGEGTRYVSEGSDAYEPARLARELNRFDQGGPVYWARKSKVSLVGVPEQTPARRALMCWHHSIDASLVTQEFLSLFDSVVKWLVKDKANATVLFSPPPGGSGDTVLVERLASNGYKIVEDDGSALSSRPAVDLVIASSNGTAGAGPSRFALYPVPLLTYNTANHDDELLSTAGQPGQTLAIGDITIEAANHPAAGGKTGAFKVVAGQAQFDTISRLLPESAIILATFQQPKAADPAVTEKAPFIVLLEEGSSGGKFYSGGPFIGFEGNDFFAGAGLNKFAGNIDPKSLTFNPVELTGKKNAKLTIALAATYLDFETSDFLDVLIDPDGDGPAQFTSLISFAASNDQDKFLNDSSTRQDSPTQLGLRFQDVTYNLPPDATKLVIRFEALNNWWNEIVAFDNIRITAGEAVVKPMVAIRRDAAQIAVDFVGVLQAAASVAGPWTDLPNAISPFAIDSSLGVQFFRARAP